MNPYEMPAEVFLFEKVPALLTRLTPETPALWGLMDAQQMVEHVSLLFYISQKEANTPCVTPPDKLERARQFLFNQKPMRENTKGPLMPDTPHPHRYPSLEEAIRRLLAHIEAYRTYHAENPGATIMHPFFGQLTGAEWALFHRKHLIHHLTQFGLLDRVPQEA
jgi:hypothetical protein